ncbi:hypothetical protein [Chitinophaga sp.]|uniref:hypothetical protein n=1 Tax=Chitinophaga sp. TaxID=1869181 RepID=UPI0031DA0808
MIQKYIEILNSLRSNQIDLREFLYLEGKDASGNVCDVNAIRRYRLLVALQYSSRLATDEAILAAFLKSEIRISENAVCGSAGESLHLCSYLLSTYRQPAYAELFYQAKFADFDTYCGYDREFILSAGIKETYQYMADVKPAFSEKFYEYFGTVCTTTEEELEEWKTFKARYFPDQLEIKDLTDEIQLAIELSEQEIMIEKIDQWVASITEWTEQQLNQLDYYKRETGDTAGRIWANERLLHFKKTDWDKTSVLTDLAKFYIELKDRDNAWAKLQLLPGYLEKIPNWDAVGLGRFAVEAYFDLILLINNAEDAVVKEAYQWVAAKIWNMKNLGWNLMEKAGKSGELMRDFELSKRFYKQLEEAKRKFEDDIKQSK